MSKHKMTCKVQIDPLRPFTECKCTLKHTCHKFEDDVYIDYSVYGSVLHVKKIHSKIDKLNDIERGIFWKSFANAIFKDLSRHISQITININNIHPWLVSNYVLPLNHFRNSLGAGYEVDLGFLDMCDDILITSEDFAKYYLLDFQHAGENGDMVSKVVYITPYT